MTHQVLPGISPLLTLILTVLAMMVNVSLKPLCIFNCTMYYSQPYGHSGINRPHLKALLGHLCYVHMLVICLDGMSMRKQ